MPWPDRPSGCRASSQSISECRGLSVVGRPPTSSTAPSRPSRLSVAGRAAAFAACRAARTASGCSAGRRGTPITEGRVDSQAARSRAAASSWDSIADAQARTSARLRGPASSAPPVRSTTPSSSPESGSRTGAATHDHGCTWSPKCSDAAICTGLRVASAVPGAFVPAPPSLHSAPATKCIDSARPRSRGGPRPEQPAWASPTATMWPASSASPRAGSARTA